MRAHRFNFTGPKPAIGSRVEHYTGWQGTVTRHFGGQRTIAVKSDGAAYGEALYSQCDFSPIPLPMVHEGEV